ncbi:MAG: DNA-directed RNA polymerase subunit beta', partial [Anaerovoracaceae bacterium]
AQAEARFLMLSVNNILAPKDGSPITTPTQDMILGTYYLTHQGTSKAKDEKEVRFFSDIEEMIMAYQGDSIAIHDRVKVRRFADENDIQGRIVESTVGRFLFNEEIPQDLGFVANRDKDPYTLEIDFLCDKKKLGLIIDKCYKVHGNTKTAIMLDKIKDIGFHYSTKGAITISISDMVIPKSKKEVVKEADDNVKEYEEFYNNGLISENEKAEKVKRIWDFATNKIGDDLMDSLGELNNLFIMADSGARGSKKQISQIGGMRGLMANASGKTIEIPIKANFREGLSVLEYFISTNGARKGLADTALRTADSGYLTRRLVDVSHNIIVRDVDCGTDEGIEVKAFTDGKEIIEPLRLRIIGRTSLMDIINPINNKLICAQGDEITDVMADAIDTAGIDAVVIRSAMTCHSRNGICAKCYGRNLATGEEVNIGEAVGITAAQSIGEPGTQLTMRTFHTGGVAGEDITHGLPRVEELFEARNPKGLAEICTADGVVESIESGKKGKTEVSVIGEDGTETVYSVPYGASIVVEKGEEVVAGANITRGPLNPHDVLKYKGIDGVCHYLLKEVQRVYKLQGVDINDKHIEVIVDQMLAKYRVLDSGDTNLLASTMYTLNEIDDEVALMKETNPEGSSPEYEVVLQGITKASLATRSFLSAASFQETTRVLTDASVKGKCDPLFGLKENVIIGKLIPAGTGMKKYRNIEVDYGPNTEYVKEYVEKQEELKRLREKEEEESRYAASHARTRVVEVEEITDSSVEDDSNK